MVRHPSGIFVRYAAAALSVVVGIGLRLALVHELGPTVPYVTFFPAVMFSAWFGGLGPGIFASVFTLLLTLGLSLAAYGGAPQSNLAGGAGGLIFLGVSFFISILTEALRRSRDRSEQRLAVLQAETKRRAAAEEELAKTSRTAEHDRDLLRTTLASIADCLIALDPEGKVTFVNSAAQTLTGWSQREAEGKAIQELLTILNERTRLPMEVEALQAIREGITVGSADDALLLTRDGREVLIEENAAPIRHENEGVLGAVLVFRDVTQRRESQRALKESEERLKLALEELQMINQDLTLANRGLEEFAYVASHDLQEPLRMVSIYTQLIAERIRNSDGEVTRYATYVREGVQRMTAIIGDLLEYSRSSHAEEIRFGKANLSESLSQAQAALINDILESGAIIHAQPLPETRGETSQMSHVFQNLLSNAIKYRKLGACPKIDISAERDGAEWVVSIQDDGIGFEPQYAERIFGLFKRLHKAEYPGTGLGLAICQRIVERYGGRIWAESALGKGAAFRFRLPSAERDESSGPAELLRN
jgi:PAS domain S-box-containing protein